MAEISTCTGSFVVDRIECGFAILENAKTLESTAVPAQELPDGVRAGFTIVYVNNAWHIDNEDTNMREIRIREKFNRIKLRDKLSDER